jgi:hypothetical protein
LFIFLFLFGQRILFFKIIGGKIPTLLGGLGGSLGISLFYFLMVSLAQTLVLPLTLVLLALELIDLNFCGCACFNA